MKTNLKIFCGLSIFAIIAVANIAHAATTSVVSNKTSQFNDVLSEMGASTTDSSNAALAETIRRQRALLDAAGDTGATGGTNITTANACDAALRKCMSEKCGADFTKCASDSTTVWGNKMDSCRRNTKCTGHEYTLLAPEILADRNAAIELSYYNSVVNCGNRYNNCVFGICGKSLENCLSKSAGDSAIAKCKSIADECREQDSGLAARVMGVFGDRRNIAATEAQRDEKRLYELRDLMRTQCTRFGAMFDERTLDCVYTVNFFAGTDNTLMASKKLYSGDTFQCTPDWFGVDITTYMENAARLTRSQTSASAAAMGAGLGTAASLWTSGAVMRGIDTQNAEKQAKEKCTAVGGEWVSAGFNQGSKCDMRKPKADCESKGGTWNDETGCSGGSSQPINLANGSGSEPEETCSSYSGGPDICTKAHGDKCSWIDSLRKCVDKGTEEQYTTPPKNDEKAWKEYCKQQLLEYDTSTKKCKPCDGNREMVDGKCTDKQLFNYAACSIYGKQNCPSDKCQWDSTANNGKGKCIPNPNPSTRGGSNPENAPSSTETEKEKEEDKNVDCSKYNKTNCQLFHARKCWWNGNDCVDASEKPETVDISLNVTNTTGKVKLLATLECQSNTYNKTSSKSETVTLKNVPSNATCKIYAEKCTTKTNLGAMNLKDMFSIQLLCKTIDDDCINNGGTWQRNHGDNDGKCLFTAQDCAKKNKAYNITTNSCYECRNTEMVLNGKCVSKVASEILPMITTPEKEQQIKLEYTLKDFDVSAEAKESCYKNFIVDPEEFEREACKDITKAPGDWAVEFSNYTIKGIATCGTSRQPNQQGNKTNGTHCYCKITSPASSQWVYLDTYQGGNCPKICTSNCAHAIRDNTKNYRQKIYGHQ